MHLNRSPARPPSAVMLAAAPALLPGSPRLPVAPISRDASGQGCAGDPDATLPSPARPPASLPALTLPGACGARRRGQLGRVPPAPYVPGGSGAGRGRARAGRGTPRSPRPLRDPPGAPPHCRWGTKGEDESHRPKTKAREGRNTVSMPV